MKKRGYVILWCIMAGFCLAPGCGKAETAAEAVGTEGAAETEAGRAAGEGAAAENEEAAGKKMTPGDEGMTDGMEAETMDAMENGMAAETADAMEESVAADDPFREEPLVIELDPGHGESGGAENERHGVLEREVNLQIALTLKEELETYENVTVYLTRDGDYDVELEERVEKAAADGADVLISLHNNGAGSICDYYNGCTVLVARGAGDPELSRITQELGCYILKELSEIGSENQGLMFRVTQDELYYDDGSLCDYYNIVRNSLKAGLPGIIVEHAFLDNEEDYQAFFSDSDKIDRLALADARGIAGYYRLKKKGSGEVLPPLENHTEKITLIVSDDYRDNTYLEKTYFAGLP